MVVENGTVPVVKSRPGRALITISAVIIAFILSLIGVLILENYKDVDWKKLSE